MTTVAHCPDGSLCVKVRNVSNSLVRMCDKYIFYVFACLKRNVSQLSDEELAQLRAPYDALHLDIDPIWLKRFKIKCENVHLERSLAGCTLHKEHFVYRHRLPSGVSVVVTENGMLLQYEDTGERRDLCALNDQDLNNYNNSMVTFEREAYRSRNNGTSYDLAISLCYTGGPSTSDCASTSAEWRYRYFITESDICGLRVVDDRIYTANGVYLYALLLSWKRSLCFTFDSTCSEDTVVTLCGLALGNSALGIEFSVCCNVAALDLVLDLRYVKPVRCDSIYATDLDRIRRVGAVDVHDRSQTLVVADLPLLPCAFSILLDTDYVLIMRHLLRDAILVVPKERSPESAIVPKGVQAKLENRRVSAFVTEWFHTNRTLVKIDNGLAGAPAMLIANGPPCGWSLRCDGYSVRAKKHVEYNVHLPDEIRPRRCVFSRSVCLLPNAMTIQLPSELTVDTCAAVMYALAMFASLSNAKVFELAFVDPLNTTESLALLATYLSVPKEFSLIPVSRIRSFASDSETVSVVRRCVANKSWPRVPLIAVSFPDSEEVISQDLEDGILERDVTTAVTAQRTTNDQTFLGSSQTANIASVLTDYTTVTGHCVSVGRCAETNERYFRVFYIGIRTLGTDSLNILRASGLYYGKHGRQRVSIRLPTTEGVVSESSLMNVTSYLIDDASMVSYVDDLHAVHDAVKRKPCFFQLNYSRADTTISLDHESTTFSEINAMSRLERAIQSEKAVGYEELRLVRLYKSARTRMERVSIDVEIAPPIYNDPECRYPYTRAWLVGPRENVETAPKYIGDGKLFPCVEIANVPDAADLDDADGLLSKPLHEYNLNLVVERAPSLHSMARADRSAGERGLVYNAFVDESVLLGHCVRLLNSKGEKRNFDISACLTCFYRAVHPCVLDLNVDEAILDYEFTVHGAGVSSPVYSLLSHLAISCRVTSIPSEKLFTLTRHRAAAVWNRGTEIDTLCTTRHRINLIGAFLCCHDHRLSRLLSRCCNPEPIQAHELSDGSDLLQLGNEEELLLNAYAKTLGPVYTFERLSQPAKIRTSLGEWSLLRLVNNSSATRRAPGFVVVDGYTIAFAAESPLFYLRRRGALVHKLESVAIVVDSSSMFRTDVLTNESPEWQIPAPIEREIKCKPKEVVLEKMFMRKGARDPLDGASILTAYSWAKEISVRWTFEKASNEPLDWNVTLPVSDSLTSIGVSVLESRRLRWTFGEPPICFDYASADFKISGGDPYVVSLRIDLDSRLARSRNLDEWKGYDFLCSRVLCSKDERVWSRGLCKITNFGLDTFEERSTVPMSHLITIIEPGQWYAIKTDFRQRRRRSVSAPAQSRDADAPLNVDVCSPRDFVCHLASVVLSGCVHEDLEIRCLQPGLFVYIQCALVWFAGATGPFRSRNVTVFTPEANEVTENWTFALNTDLDVVHTNTVRYTVSLFSANVYTKELDVFLNCSHAIVRIKTLGDLVLHSDLQSVSLAIARKDRGVHVVAKQPSADTDFVQSQAGNVVYLTNERSLKQYCELQHIPRGVRGPDVWTRNTPWTKKDPSSFCRDVSKMKYRWESGACGASKALAREEKCQTNITVSESFACLRARSKDDKLISETGRFWNRVDETESKTWRRDVHESRDVDETEEEALDSSSDDSQGTCALLTTEYRWRDSDNSCSVSLNARLEIEIVYEKPACYGHVFFKPVFERCFDVPLQLHDDGAVTKYYEPYKFGNIVHYVYTLSVFGCGLVPVFFYSRDNELANETLRLAFGTLALSDRLLGEAQPKKNKIVLVVDGDRAGAVTFARAIENVVVVARVKGIVRAYSFAHLPDVIETKVQPVNGNSRHAQSELYANPVRFLMRRGADAFARAIKRYPALLKRNDVRHPLSARDPRWIGLVLYISEWTGDNTMADEMVPGSLESLMGVAAT